MLEHGVFEVEPWDWAETEEDEPVVMIERHASFTGMTARVDGQIPLEMPDNAAAIIRHSVRQSILFDLGGWPKAVTLSRPSTL